MAKKVIGQVKLQIAAGKATPAPPVGTALGPHGVNIMDFCKQFNAKTQEQAKENLVIPVIITVYADRSFSFVTKSPPASILLKKAAGLHLNKKPASGSREPGKVNVGTVTMDQCKEIAQMKMEDLNCHDTDAGGKIIAGTARSMGITVS